MSKQALKKSSNTPTKKNSFSDIDMATEHSSENTQPIDKEASIERIGKQIETAISKKIINPKRIIGEDRSYTSCVGIQQRIADSDVLSERSKHFLTEYIDRLEELKWIHSRSSEYYESRNIAITIPSIVLTSLSGIMSFMSTSSGVSPQFQYISSITVGVIAAISSLVQALSSTLQFGTKSELHRDVADRYEKIITSIKFEFVDHSDENFIEELEKQIIEVQNMCKYFPPMFFYEEYRKFKKKEQDELKRLQINNENKNIQTDPYELTSILIDKSSAKDV
jgi:hypothetical protein